MAENDVKQEANAKIEKVIIIGSGPSGHTAAIYAGRALLAPLMFEGFLAGGIAAGGQLTTTTEVENFPGFPEGIYGPELMERMREQSVKSGAHIKTENVTGVDLNSRPFKVYAENQIFYTKALIIATGATAKRLHVPSEQQYWQKGISACAVCDGALPVYRNKPLAVVGGGDTAAEESLFLTRFASSITLLVRRDVMRASKVMQERIGSHPKIKVMWNTAVVDVFGDQVLRGLHYKNTETGATGTLEVAGLFYAIGHQPNTDFLAGQLELDETGYIITQSGSVKTKIPGVFACGDVKDKVYRQAITAAGSGCMAAIEAERFLAEAE
jgi:thioredoxin reductase (NADPH)